MYNPFKAHIVKFDENVYAIRKFYPLLGWEYQDLVSPSCWWGRDERHFIDCIGDKSEVEAVYNIFCKKGERV